MTHFKKKFKLRILSLAICSAIIFLFLKKNSFSFKKKEIDLSDEVVLQSARGLYLSENHYLQKQPKSLVNLGKRLFFDPRLSSKNDKSCATCHNPKQFFTDGKNHPPFFRNSQVLWGLEEAQYFFWDGRSLTLEDQVFGPLFHPKEMAGDVCKIFDVVNKFYSKDELFSKHLSHEEQVWSQVYLQTFHEESSWHLYETPLAYAVSTMKPFTTQVNFLNQAQNKKIAPSDFLAKELQKVLMEQGFFSHLTFDDCLQIDRAKVLSTSFRVAQALAAYEKSIRLKPSEFDLFLDRADKVPLSQAFNKKFAEEEWRGLKVFMSKGQCVNCHFGKYFTDREFHNIGLGETNTDSYFQLGRIIGAYLLEKSTSYECLNANHEICAQQEYFRRSNIELVGAFKTPSLRNVVRTSPYMHDGRFKTLDEVLNHYQKTDLESLWGHREEVLKQVQLTNEDIRALKKFLESLNSEISPESF